MSVYAVPSLILYVVAGFVFILTIVLAILLASIVKRRTSDMILFIDESNRWSAKYDKLDNTSYNDNEKKYFLKSDCSLLNNKGKKLFIFSKNKPQPMKLKYNSNEWLDSDALMASINNELIKMMVNPKNPVKDMVILLGAVGGMIAGISTVLILLKQFGVI